MGSLTHTGMDYLFFRRKFTWTDEDSLISWYNHLRWSISLYSCQRETNVPTHDTYLKVIHCYWWRDSPLCDFALACANPPAARHDHRHHRRALPGGQVPHLLLCGRQEFHLLRHRLFNVTLSEHSAPKKLDDEACGSGWVDSISAHFECLQETLVLSLLAWPRVKPFLDLQLHSITKYILR